MITENDVVEACARFLKAEGWEIEQALNTTQQGVDIIATREEPRSRMLVEAKGGTSSKSHTMRFGKPFTLGQARSHISRALYEAARVVARTEPGQEAAIALPSDANHRSLIRQIEQVLATLQIAVLWVAEDGSVSWGC